MIVLEKVNKYFNHHKKNQIHVINNTSLTLPDNGLVAMLGPSGCGKTTLLNAIGGLDKIKSGKIYINNQRITKRCVHKVDKIRNLNIGYIFQHFYLIDNKTVFENVALSLKMIGIKDKEEIKKRVNFVLETLGIYRYRNRPASMLSGGERQRVGIARAIVKDPDIIIADEPTGNLDSKNTIDIMNIIKSISKTRLVLLVTHESDIAKFYADRVIELEDGKIKNDYNNNHNNSLDYRIDNKFYLKDFKNKSVLENKDNQITIYNDKQNDIKLTIVVKNNNIYIKGSKNSKIEVVDDSSNIEFLNEHYKEIDKSIYEKYEFNFASIISKNFKLKYSSIFNIFTLVINGFKKLLDYSFIKKVLLLGFLASGAFVTYSISNIAGITKIEDKYFTQKNKLYYDVTIASTKGSLLNELDNLGSVDYILPGNSKINLGIKYQDYYQTINAASTLTGSLTSDKYLNNSKLILGKMPSNEYEIVVDKMALDNMIENQGAPKQLGYTNLEDFIGKEAYLRFLDPFIIVGVVDNGDPSIYVKESIMTDMLANNNSADYYNAFYYEDDYYEEGLLFNYERSNIKIKKGRAPLNDYEIIVNIDNEYSFPLDKEIDQKIGDKKLKVVGYYENNNDTRYYTNKDTLRYYLAFKAKSLTVMPKDESKIIDEFNNKNLNIKSSYEVSLNNYKNEKSDSMKASLIVSFVILAISFIEIFLMIRASFLSRIKEIGIYRAIGVKRTDICKMFMGEILAITTITGIPAVMFVSYALKNLMTINFFEMNYVVNLSTILISIIILYIFNIVVGLIPVFNIIRQTPAAILSRKDIDN